MNARTKPTLSMKEATHTAQQADLEALARAVVTAITMREKNIVLRFPYFAVFAKDFPKGVCIKKEGYYDYFSCKVWRLANYLHSKGVLPADYKGLMLLQRDWGYREKKLEKLLAQPEELLYNSNLANVEEEA